MLRTSPSTVNLYNIGETMVTTSVFFSKIVLKTKKKKGGGVKISTDRPTKRMLLLPLVNMYYLEPIIRSDL